MTLHEEQERLLALERYHIMDTASEKQFDDLVALAAQICEAPIALISLVDARRQWFKAKIGIEVAETPREISACQYAIEHSDVMIIPDTDADERFKNSPLVTGDPRMRFYAGAPLSTPSGHRVGTICVIDTKPRELTAAQKSALETLSHQVVTLLELRLTVQQKDETERMLLDYIAERKRVETAFREASERYQTLFESIDEGFCIIELLFDAEDRPYDYRFIEVNPAFTLHTGIAGAQGRTMREFSSDLETLWFEIYGKVAKTGEPIRFTNHAEPLGRWFDVYAFRVGDAGENRVAVLFTDITARRQVDTDLQESEAHLNLMIESAYDYAIISLSAEGMITSWNTGAEFIFGYTPAQAIGQPFKLIFTPEDQQSLAWQREMRGAAQHGRASDERWHERADGTRFFASGMLAAMYDRTGQVRGFVKIARDMTEKHRQQEALLEARNAAEAANIAKTEFLANMSHEIRTPMNAIIGLSNILVRTSPLTDKQREFIETLQMSADSLLKLINDLLDISKIEARTIELEQIPFNLAQLMQDITSMMAVRVAEKDLRLVMDCSSVREQLYIGDPTRLRQVALNLCSNAIKFTEKGTVTIAVDAQKEKDGYDWVTIAFTDTGIGIEADKLAMIFEKFVQADTSINRKYGGTGLGLAITKTIAEIMGGAVTVESALGVGSTFRLTVPLRRVAAQDVPVAVKKNTAVALPKPAHDARILLVEDYEPNVLVAATVLEQFGYAVEVAHDGQAAVEMMKQGGFAAALMDVQMHGMNGLQATQHIRAHERDQGLKPLLIIGMTAHALTGDRERCLACGMDDYITKPFSPDLLREKLESRLAA